MRETASGKFNLGVDVGYGGMEAERGSYATLQEDNEPSWRPCSLGWRRPDSQPDSQPDRHRPSHDDRRAAPFGPHALPRQVTDRSSLASTTGGTKASRLYSFGPGTAPQRTPTAVSVNLPRKSTLDHLQPKAPRAEDGSCSPPAALPLYPFPLLIVRGFSSPSSRHPLVRSNNGLSPI